LKQNGADNTRTASNRWEGNPDYESSYAYQHGNNAYRLSQINPQHPEGLVPQRVDHQYDGI